MVVGGRKCFAIYACTISLCRHCCRAGGARRPAGAGRPELPTTDWSGSWSGQQRHDALALRAQPGHHSVSVGCTVLGQASGRTLRGGYVRAAAIECCRQKQNPAKLVPQGFLQRSSQRSAMLQASCSTGRIRQEIFAMCSYVSSCPLGFMGLNTK